MALKNASGNYLKIVSVSMSTINTTIHGYISYNVYETETIRQNGLGQFQNVYHQAKNYSSFELSNDKATAFDNLMSGAYNTLKATDFPNWSDC